MWFKTIMCKLGIHDWDNWKLWRFSRFETKYGWEMKMCKRCALKKYRKLT